MLSRKQVEKLGERAGVFNPREVAARDLDRLDTQYLARHAPLPRRLEDLILGGVDKYGRDVGMPGKRKLVRRRDCRAQPLGKRPASGGVKARVHRVDRS